MARLRILNPCDASWEAMRGTERVRHCDACDKDVHDLTHLSEREASGYARLRGGASMCARILVVSAAVAACGSPQRPTPPARPADHARDVLEAGIAEEPAADPNLDSDKDGVPDRDDACPYLPGEPPGHGHDGCPEVHLVVGGELPRVLKQIHFAKSKTAVSSEGTEIVDEVVAALKAHAEIARVEIGGHASIDERGAQALSEKRAAVVIAKIVAEGIDSKRLVAMGYATTRPLDNKTEDGRAENRRVEFRILDDGEPACAIDAGSP